MFNIVTITDLANFWLCVGYVSVREKSSVQTTRELPQSSEKYVLFINISDDDVIQKYTPAYF